MDATQGGPGGAPGPTDTQAASWSRWAGGSGLLASAALVTRAVLSLPLVRVGGDPARS